MAELNKEIWLDQLLKGLYPATSFLNYVRDFSNLVDNEKIHLAEAGVDPEVLVNNTVYPIPVDLRIDEPIEIELKKFETKNTLVRRPDYIQYSYDQLEGVLYSHRMALRTKTAAVAAHAYAPLQDTDFTPVIQASGERDDSDFYTLTFEDILRLKRRFDDVDIPFEKRFLVLNPRHTEDLMRQDMKAFKDILEMVNGQPSKVAGFSILEFSKNPTYDNATNHKKAYGAAALPGDSYCSFAFQGDEVMKADGVPHMYATIDDPKERGTIVGFDMRFIGLPLRNKGIGALISRTPNP